METKIEGTIGTAPLEELYDPEIHRPDDNPSVWDELDAAYQKGVDSV